MYFRKQRLGRAVGLRQPIERFLSSTCVILDVVGTLLRQQKAACGPQRLLSEIAQMGWQAVRSGMQVSADRGKPVW